MSVIAGCSLFNGVMLAADCRVTIPHKQAQPLPIYCDIAQKLFTLTNNCAIGFVGDLDVASHLLCKLFDRIKGIKRRDATSLEHWLPRFLRYSFEKLKRERASGNVEFMVAAVIPEKPNVIDRQSVVDIMEVFRKGTGPSKRTWMPGILLEIIKTDPAEKFVELLDCPKSLLYTMKCPRFVRLRLVLLFFHDIPSSVF